MALQSLSLKDTWIPKTSQRREKEMCDSWTRCSLGYFLARHHIQRLLAWKPDYYEENFGTNRQHPPASHAVETLLALDLKQSNEKGILTSGASDNLCRTNIGCYFKIIICSRTIPAYLLLHSPRSQSGFESRLSFLAEKRIHLTIVKWANLVSIQTCGFVVFSAMWNSE